MAHVPIFHGRVSDDGRLELSVAEETTRGRYLACLRGRDVEVIVRRPERKRSLDQNAYWHKVPFKLLAEACGDSIESIKFDLLGEWSGWIETKGGNRVPVKPHTSQLTTAEGAEFTDWLVRFGATLPSPVFIPLPDEVAA